MRFDGKVAVVTGGGSGIGAATARLLAEAGARVAVIDRDAAAAEAVAAEIGGLARASDVGDPGAVAADAAAIVSG
ncbi:SDR family NAD(P)-dependent oxidoreductase, partial [uncultured Methylobacterium sp.]|uniref:SDR family NAD(P)-dependent oxidoreductase n=1 Tax=uncultured Methylobacterium sp. TaxID=157278 RepID=UPI00259377ED